MGRRPSGDCGRNRLSPSGQAGHFMDQQFLWTQFMPLKKMSLGKLDRILENALGRPVALECKGISGVRGQDGFANPRERAQEVRCACVWEVARRLAVCYVLTSLTDSGGNDSTFSTHLCLVDTLCSAFHYIPLGRKVGIRVFPGTCYIGGSAAEC